MNTNKLHKLLDKYYSSSEEFQATAYWEAYEKPILAAIERLRIEEMRCQEPILGAFGFSERVYDPTPSFQQRIKVILWAARQVLVRKKGLMPYSIGLEEIREMAYRHCEIYGELTGSRPISSVETSRFGSPEDLFVMHDKMYTMAFLTYYVRHCFVNKFVNFAGDEIVVELGSGSGHQVEVLKRLFPDMTILCFDLPAQLFLCEEYLKNSFGADRIVSSEESLEWGDLDRLERGKIHFLGNWMMPLLQELNFDLFWNAASFGEMEPEIVENYLSMITGRCEYVYLNEAKSAETRGRIVKSTYFEDYDRYLDGYENVSCEQPYQANRPLTASGGYFHGIWKRKSNQEQVD